MGLSVGDPAPDFDLEGTDGRFRLSDHRGSRVVLLFYPGDFTTVCTRQFCSYAERAEDLAALDAIVVGISREPVATHHEFREVHAIPVPLLADEDGSVSKAYGVTGPLVGTRRAMVIVDEQGRVAHHSVHLFGLDYESVDDIGAALEGIGTAGAGSAA